MSGELVRTNAKHLVSGGGKPGAAGKVINERKPWEVSPSSNGVVVEEQMMKSAEAGTDYQLMTNLYRKNLGMIRTALGRNGGI
jgi:flagellar basal-body rod protein FlgB